MFYYTDQPLRKILVFYNWFFFYKELNLNISIVSYTSGHEIQSNEDNNIMINIEITTKGEIIGLHTFPIYLKPALHVLRRFFHISPELFLTISL